jgi:hypothetical protein
MDFATGKIQGHKSPGRAICRRSRAGMDAGYNDFISFLRSKKLTAQKWHGCHF